jgi:hypothetical protein
VNGLVIPGAALPPTRSRLDWASPAWPLLELGGAAVVRSQYYEVRLGAGLEQLDYLVAFSRSAAEVVRDLVRDASGHAPFLAPEWRDIARLLNDWAHPGSLIAERCPTIWFEYDDVVHANSGLVPSLSVCLTPRYRVTEPHRVQAPLDLQVAREALTLLGAASSSLEALEVVFAALPADARFIHVSYMLGRPTRAVKLYGAFERHELMAYLERIAWAGNRDAILDALARFYPERLLGGTVFIDLNLENLRDPARATLGLAVAQQHLHMGPDRDPARRRILRTWTENGLCAAEKVARVQTWPASSDQASLPPFEAEHRFLDVKLVWQAGAGITPKAYVGRERLRGLF